VSAIRRHRTRALAVMAVAAAAMMVVVGSASGIIIKSGNIEVELDGGISPSALPKKDRAPLTLKLEGKLETTDNTHISAVKTVSLDFDKAGELFTKGLPSCTTGVLESTLTAQAKAKCKSAIVGSGFVTADIALPEQRPFGARGPLVIFNGSKGGKQMLILHVHANVPAPTTFVVPVAIKKKGGKYGTNAFIKVPTIVSGDGSVTSFKASIGKKFTVKGERESLLSAYCKTGALFVKGDLAFANGSKLKGVFSEKCTPKG
jgi:hypothetical protein